MPLDADRLAERLGDQPLQVYESTPNTADWIREQGHEGAPAGAYAVADELTAARGRTGADWAAPAGGVWANVLLRPSFGPRHVGRLTFAGGLAALDTVRAFDIEAGLKWPNDVVVVRDGVEHKLAGVLPEAVVDGVPIAGKPVDEALSDPQELVFATLGVGINADLAPEDVGVDRPVTTMRAETGGPVDVTDVAATLHERLLARASAVETADGFADTLDAWRAATVTLGHRVRATMSDGPEVEGEATGVGEDGALLIDTGDGTVAITEGECERVRQV
jgi:BirA family biotin operon repressor/biotin-[acetyl-CoA-carboxylase] ligase